MPETAEGHTSDKTDDLALYIHWPFCISKCPYCDFNSHVSDSIDQSLWRSALLQELRTEINENPDRCITSVFFGGGTPSLMAPGTVNDILETAAKFWKVDRNLEVTLEANPTSVETGNLNDFKRAGINRLSLGIQSLEDSALKFLGREHSAREALLALDTAREIFPRYSFDLIYCRPHQSLTAWERELTAALEYTGDHISLYQLTIERGTAFFSLWRNGGLTMPDESISAGQFEQTQGILENAGLPAYEISNHAKPGHESQHNLNYWQYGDYVGIGPGAHGRIQHGNQKLAVRRIASPENWRQQVMVESHGIQEKVQLTSAEIFEEMMLMGLRLRRGIDLASLQDKTQQPLFNQINENALANLISAGFMKKTPYQLKATRAGRQRLNAIMATLLDRDC